MASKRGGKKPRKFVVVADNHGDMQDNTAVAALWHFMDDFRPDIRIHLGDLFDWRPIRNGASQEEKQESMKADEDAGFAFANRLFKGGKENYYLRGNHSLSDDTELLTSHGWKPVNRVTLDDKIAEFDPMTRVIFFNKPLDLESHHEDFIYEIEGRYSKQKVSSGHDVVLWGQKVKAKDLLGKTIKEDGVATSGITLIADKEEDRQWVRLLTWVVMDGCIVNLTKYDPKTTKARIQFKLSKPRKIERLRALLDEMGLPYTFAECKKSGINKLQPYYIRLYGDAAREIVERLGGKKEIPASWARLPIQNLETFLVELQETDGGKSNQHIRWHTTSKHDADVVQEWCLRNRYDCAYTKRINMSGFANGKPQYHVKICRGLGQCNQDLSISKVPYGRDVHCVTMPMGTIITRVDGKVAFTGNCERLWDIAGSADGNRRDLALYGIERVETQMKLNRAKMFPYDVEKGVLTLGGINFLHGYHHGLHAAAEHAKTYGTSVFGHVHTDQLYHAPGYPTPKVGIGLGCLCRLDMKYISRHVRKLRWSHSWAFGLIFDDDTHIINRAIRKGDKFYAATEIQPYG